MIYYQHLIVIRTYYYIISFYFLPIVPPVITNVMSDDVTVCSTGWSEPKVTAFIMVGVDDPWST